MRICNILILLVNFVVVSLFFSTLAISAELIEPSRTLEGEQQTTGRLTVLSEPPGLNITLNGDSLGKTPAFLVEVQEGVHTLRVKDSQTDIYVKPDETLKISLHKDEFIIIPTKKIEIEEQPVTEIQPEKRPTTVTTTRDPIRQNVERDRRRSQQRWQKFLDGTKPTP
jgi:hypothetical protein